VISLALALLHARAGGASRTHLAPWRLTTDVGAGAVLPGTESTESLVLS
jgi:hypothetical protein